MKRWRKIQLGKNIFQRKKPWAGNRKCDSFDGRYNSDWLEAFSRLFASPPTALCQPAQLTGRNKRLLTITRSHSSEMGPADNLCEWSCLNLNPVGSVVLQKLKKKPSPVLCARRCVIAPLMNLFKSVWAWITFLFKIIKLNVLGIISNHRLIHSFLRSYAWRNRLDKTKQNE